MKGVVFRALEDLVIEQHGIQTWDIILDQVNLSDRYYLGPQSYPDEELFSIVQEIGRILNVPLPDLIRGFGQYLFGYLANSHKDIVSQFDSFEALIKGIDSVIHKEVKKLYSEPNLPSISVDFSNSDSLIVVYDSPRKLCFCSEGLIYGAAAHFGVTVKIEHQQCAHHGADKCILLVRKV
ncbi:heme NO-binding domain-containing protein [Pseudoalteromonas xiamenensis]